MHFTTKRRSMRKASATRTADKPVDAPTPSPAAVAQAPRRSHSVPLITVPETSKSSSAARPPPSAFRNFAFSSLNGKGKEPQMEPDLPTPVRTGWSKWVVDPLEARRGADVWSQGERVILVLGEPTVESLAPLLYSPAFINTLLLVGSIHPLPDIEALTSPSHLMSLGQDGTIYPTIQPFQPPAEALQGSGHPLHVLLKQAGILADAHRQRLGPESAPTSRPTSWGSRSRRGSGTSGTLTPPQMGSNSRFGSFGRRSANSSPMASPSGSSLDLARLGSPTKSRTPSIMTATSPTERPRGLRRISSLLSVDLPRPCEGPPFDAVINFIPSAARTVDPQRVLQDMLHHTVVLTTAVLPIMITASHANSVTATIAATDLAPLTVLHIIPSDAPPVLAPVIERFLIPLLPQLRQHTRRELFGCITGLGPWLSSTTDPSGDGLDGAQTILFGGLRSPQQDGLRTQALLSRWDQCVTSHGTLVDAAHRSGSETPPAFSSRASSQALAEMRSAHVASSSTSPPTSPTKPLSAAENTLAHMQSLPMMRPKIRTQLDSQAPITADSVPSRSYVSRFDPRVREGQSDLQAPITLSQQPPAGASPAAAAPVAAAVSSAAPRSPSGLRNSHQPSLQASPPTPELDPSSSSCSSSSVLDPPHDERSVNSGSSRRVASTPAGKPTIVAKPSRFGSLFRRSRGVKA